MTIEKKTWLITGCSTGFGRVLTEALLQTSANVVATARQTEALSGLTGDRLLKAALDVTDPSSIQQAVAAAHERFGRIDVLVNNAGYGMLGAVEECALDEAQRMFDTNVFGLVRVTQAVLPIMRTQRTGHIFNISSAAGIVPTAGFGLYNGSKFAVEGISQAMALEVNPLGIAVTLIEPGPFRTDFAGRSLNTQKPITDYEDTVGKTRARMQILSGNQPGDPQKAARIMIELAQQDNPPLQVPLGNDAMNRIKARSIQWKEEMERIEPLARTADYDDKAA
jgi:NAD(P)-dependent dehydrogenase (short-subunit alcohol dehydrogenase family)